MEIKLSHYFNKYKDKFYRLKDILLAGQKVIYLPAVGGLSHCYDWFRWKRIHPGDIFTVSYTDQEERVNAVYMQETDAAFSPAELAPVEAIDPNDLQIMRSLYLEIIMKYGG